MTNAHPRTCLVIPTLNAGPRWDKCLEAINRQSLALSGLLVIDSSSTDATAELARRAGFEVIGIERAQFNHGGTRQWAVEHLSSCEIVVFLTQDAILADSNALSELVGCFADERVAVAYGRQLPHPGATPIEAHARTFNYGPRSERKDAGTVAALGTKTFFCSNSFAAYRRSTFLALGGFKRDLILGEDMEFAARAVKAGFAVAYCATALVHHSHDYTVKESLRRYFDIGAFDNRNRWMREQFGSHGAEGLRFIASELHYLIMHAPFAIPRALLQTAAKIIGYRLGRLESLFPDSLNRVLSMSPSYWRFDK